MIPGPTACRKRWAHLLKTVRFPPTVAKRRPFTPGLLRPGEIPDLDSDSVIDPDAPATGALLLAEAQMGAVAGNVKVFNRHQSLMQDAGCASVNLITWASQSCTGPGLHPGSLASGGRP
jgi:hypothetical protein